MSKYVYGILSSSAGKLYLINQKNLIGSSQKADIILKVTFILHLENFK